MYTLVLEVPAHEADGQVTHCVITIKYSVNATYGSFVYNGSYIIYANQY